MKTFKKIYKSPKKTMQTSMKRTQSSSNDLGHNSSPEITDAVCRNTTDSDLPSVVIPSTSNVLEQVRRLLQKKSPSSIYEIYRSIRVARRFAAPTIETPSSAKRPSFQSDLGPPDTFNRC